MWLAFVQVNLGSHVRVPISADHSSLALSPSGQRLPKLLPYCPQTGLIMLYAFAVIASYVLNTKREHRKLRCHYKKSKPAPLTGRRPSILASMKPIGTTGI